MVIHADKDCDDFIVVVVYLLWLSMQTRVVMILLL